MKKGIIQIFLSNIIFLLFGILSNFILPKYLSIDSYAYIKTYMLYLSYAGFLSIGYMEGMFLKYGGNTVRQSKKLGFGDNFRTYMVLQMVIGTIIFLIGIAIGDSIVLLSAFGVVTTNILNYFKNYCTAVAEYRMYSVITGFEKVAIFLCNVILVFVVRTDNGGIYVGALIIVSCMEIYYITKKMMLLDGQIFHGRFQINEIKICISIGIILLLGNGISTLFTGIDQWFVKLLMQNREFALYSFAVSMERIIAVFITPITTVLYNYFCQNRNRNEISFLQDVLALWGLLMLLMVFPLRWFITRFISNYSDAVAIISILFCGQALSCIISGIYVNLFKAEKQQGKFLRQMIVMTLISIMLNAVFYVIFRNMICIALATLLTKLIWLIVCEIECREYSYDTKGNIAIFLAVGVFLVCTFISNSILGFMLYVGMLGIVGFGLLRKSTIRAINEMIGFITNQFSNGQERGR